MLTTIKSLLFFILIFQIGLSQNYRMPYFSPGLHMGYSWDQGWFYSVQATLGYWDEDLPGINPGITFGIRKSNLQIMKYIDLQFAFSDLGLVGYGFGRAWINDKRHPDTQYFCKRRKFWGGAFGLITLDYHIMPYKQKIFNSGIMLVKPFTLKDGKLGDAWPI